MRIIGDFFSRNAAECNGKLTFTDKNKAVIKQIFRLTEGRENAVKYG